MDGFSLRLADFFAERGRLGPASAAAELGPASEPKLAATALVTRAVGSRGAGEGSAGAFFCLLLLRGRLALLLSSSLDCFSRSCDRLRALRVSGIVDGNVCHHKTPRTTALDQ